MYINSALSRTNTYYVQMLMTLNVERHVFININTAVCKLRPVDSFVSLTKLSNFVIF